MTDFLESIGYELPDDAPEQVESEDRSFYRHPIGQYKGFVGKLIPRYKDSQGNSCDKDDAGAKFSHYLLPLWTTKFLGSSDKPVDVTLIHPETLAIPDKPSEELHFLVYVPIEASRVWTLKKMCSNWSIPEHKEFDIVKPSPTNPGNKVINYKGFPAYYGLPVSFSLTFKPDPSKDNSEIARYVDGEIEIIDYHKRYPKQLLDTFEKNMEAKREAEREARKSSNSSSGYSRPDAPQTNFDDLANSSDDASNEDSTDLDDFLKS